MTDSTILTKVVERRIVPVAVLDSLDNAVPLAKALAEAGLPLIEITLRTPCALDCIRAIRQQCPEMVVGAGTVMETSQLTAAIEAGAQFGVSPGLNETVVRAAIDKGMFFLPGVMTPSEVERSLHLGCKLLKFFPADAAGGTKMLKAFAGPYEHTGVRFVPLGGIGVANMADYLALPIVAAIGGSWLCDRKLVREKKWTEIRTLCAQALANTRM